MTIQATPTKLRSGDWGAKVQGSVNQGDTIEITARSGKRWLAVVAKVVWSGDGVAIVATRSLGYPRLDDPGRHSRSRGTRTGCSCGSVEEFEKPSDCWTCRHDR